MLFFPVVFFSFAGSLSFVLVTSLILTMIYAATMTLFSNMMGMSVEIGIFLFYCILFLLVMVPNMPGQETRGSFFRLLRLVFFPSTSISFPEVMLADAMTSMSKILKDIGKS